MVSWFYPCLAFLSNNGSGTRWQGNHFGKIFSIRLSLAGMSFSEPFVFDSLHAEDNICLKLIMCFSCWMLPRELVWEEVAPRHKKRNEHSTALHHWTFITFSIYYSAENWIIGGSRIFQMRGPKWEILVHTPEVSWDVGLKMKGRRVGPPLWIRQCWWITFKMYSLWNFPYSQGTYSQSLPG